jgi:WhiB family transcriptional regulator, redox-sensing transcriptional regulator
MTTMAEPITSMTWDDYGSCLTYDPDGWYVDGTGKSPAYDQLTEAKRICQACPVRTWCLNTTMNTEGKKGAENRHGIRGGLTPVERAALHRRRTRSD